LTVGQAFRYKWLSKCQNGSENENDCAIFPGTEATFFRFLEPLDPGKADSVLKRSTLVSGFGSVAG
jgi:hypothetical protein